MIIIRHLFKMPFPRCIFPSQLFTPTFLKLACWIYFLTINLFQMEFPPLSEDYLPYQVYLYVVNKTDHGISARTVSD